MKDRRPGWYYKKILLDTLLYLPIYTKEQAVSLLKDFGVSEKTIEDRIIKREKNLFTLDELGWVSYDELKEYIFHPDFLYRTSFQHDEESVKHNLNVARNTCNLLGIDYDNIDWGDKQNLG